MNVAIFYQLSMRNGGRSVQAGLPESHGHLGVQRPVAVLRVTLLLSLKQLLAAILAVSLLPLPYALCRAFQFLQILRNKISLYIATNA